MIRAKVTLHITRVAWGHILNRVLVSKILCESLKSSSTSEFALDTLYISGDVLGVNSAVLEDFDDSHNICNTITLFRILATSFSVQL